MPMDTIRLSKSGLFVPYAEPQPFSTSDEQRLRDVLKGIDSALDLRWFRYAIFSEQVERFEGRYALVCDWMSEDPRMKLVQHGEVDPNEAHDIIGWFCEDVQNAETVPVGVEAVENLAMKLLAGCDNSRTPIKQRLAQIAAKNVARRRAVHDEMLDMMHDEAGSHWWARQPKVFGGTRNE